MCRTDKIKPTDIYQRELDIRKVSCISKRSVFVYWFTENKDRISNIKIETEKKSFFFFDPLIYISEFSNFF